MADWSLNELAKRNNLRKEELEHAKEALGIKDAEKKLTEDQVRLVRQLFGEMQKSAQVLETEKATLSAIVDLEKQRAAMERDYSQILATNKELRSADISLVQQQIRAQQQTIANANAETDAGRSKIAAAQQHIAQLTQQEALLRGQRSAHDSIERGAKGVLKTTLGISNAWEGTLTGGMAKAIASGAEMGDVTATLGNALRATVASWQGVANIAFSTLQKMQEMTIRNVKAMDTLNASYTRATGLVTQNSQVTGVFNSELQQGFYATTKLYASMEELNSARTALATSSSRYVDMSTRERQALDGLGIMLEKAGYGVQMLAKNFDTYTIGMGMTLGQTEAFTRSVVAMGQQIGITSSQLSRDFPAALKIAIQYTGRETQVLRGLMQQAKATGLEMSQLTGIVAQYDTFEGAGEAVGRLNAILGGPYLNAIQMVYATEDQRLQLLRQSVAASGRQFATLAKYEQKAIMAAAGINDINTALQMFGGGGAAFERQIRQQKELEELSRKATPIFQQITASLQRLALAGAPFVTMLEKISSFMMNVMPKSVNGALVAFNLFSGAAALAVLRMKAMAVQFVNTKIEQLQANSALQVTSQLVRQVAQDYQRMGAEAERASTRTVSGLHRVQAASAGARAGPGGLGPGQSGQGVGVPLVGGGGRGGMSAGTRSMGIGMLAQMIATISAPMIAERVKDRKTAAAIQAIPTGMGIAQMVLMGLAVGGAPMSGGASLGLLAAGGALGAAGGYMSAHNGGLRSGPVPGPRGRETMIRAQGGEMVVQPEQLAALARGSQDPRLGQNVDTLNQTVNNLGSQLSNFEHTVNQLMGAHMGKKSDMFVTVNMDSKQVTEQVISNLETNPNYGLALG